MAYAIKVLVNDKSCHGGAFDWTDYLPTQAADGTWVPGQPTPARPVSICSTGWHLVPLAPAGQPVPGMLISWWKAEAVAYLVEYESMAETVASGDKLCVESCKLLRPLSVAELANHQIYSSGEHKVGRGCAVALGNASVRVSGNTSVRVSDNASVRVSDNASVRAWGNASVVAWDNASVRAWGNASVGAWGNASVVVSGNARCHAGGCATAIVQSGESVILTRADRGVLIDRRGDVPVTYVRRAGIGGWRFRPEADGAPKWVHVEVRPKTK